MALEIDHFLGGDFFYKLSATLVSFLFDLDFTKISHMQSTNASFNSCNYWYSDSILGLTCDLALEWSHFIVEINHNGMRHNDDAYFLVWAWNRNVGQVSAKDANDVIIVSTIVVKNH